MGKRIAIVGSNCSGIAALWALSHTDHKVHIFEKADRFGGHTHTSTINITNGPSTSIDIGFMTMYRHSYSNFIRFLHHVGVPTQQTEISFAVSRDNCGPRWVSSCFETMNRKDHNFPDTCTWTLLFERFRFWCFVKDLITGEAENHKNTAETANGRLARKYQHVSIGNYLDSEHYSPSFKYDYLIPLLWSMSPDRALMDFPVTSLVKYLWNHELYRDDEPDWVTIPGGAAQFIRAVTEDHPDDCKHTSTEVTEVVPEVDGKVLLRTKSEEFLFDHVILAVQADRALDLLGDSATPQEKEILECFRTTQSIAVLHADTSLLPKQPTVCTISTHDDETLLPRQETHSTSKICLTYCLNRLQQIPEEHFEPLLLTVNPIHPPCSDLVRRIDEYSHPMYDAQAVEAQKLLHNIQNKRGISYCGAWTRHGLHEECFDSGLGVAQDHFGAMLPFEFVDWWSLPTKRPPANPWECFTRFWLFLMWFCTSLWGFLTATMDLVLEKRRTRTKGS